MESFDDDLFHGLSAHWIQLSCKSQTLIIKFYVLTTCAVAHLSSETMSSWLELGAASVAANRMQAANSKAKAPFMLTVRGLIQTTSVAILHGILFK